MIRFSQGNFLLEARDASCFKVLGADLAVTPTIMLILLMDKILHDPKDPKLWELWYIPYNG